MRYTIIMVVGIDEVGRGAWAGPLVVGAVLLGNHTIEGLTDSKKLTAKRRSNLAKEIRENAVALGLGWVSAQSISKIGLSKALQVAAQLALKEIRHDYTQVIIDGTVRFIDDPRVTTMKQADLLVPSVSAASIIAKVARDYYMAHVAAKDFPDFGFEHHVGYGTAMHRQAIKQYGVTELHRRSFKPIKAFLGSNQGAEAERLAALYLQEKGYTVIARNWRTKWCEIDLIVQKQSIIYFVEVKHRHTSAFGDGLAAISPKKLAQMRFAAELWRQQYNHSGLAQLAVIAMSGQVPEVDIFLENVE